MEIDNSFYNLEVIFGCVASGKSEEFIRRIKRHEIAGHSVIVFKPDIDTRTENIKSRNGIEINCEPIHSNVDKLLTERRFNFDGYDVIAFEEAQFFKNLYSFIDFLLLRHKHKIIVSGLLTDFNNNFFGDIYKLIKLSTNITHLKAICMKCKNENAIFSQKLTKGGPQIEVGDLEKYEPRCYKCFIPGGI